MTDPQQQSSLISKEQPYLASVKNSGDIIAALEKTFAKQEKRDKPAIPVIAFSLETIKNGSYLWSAIERGSLEDIAVALKNGANPTYNYSFIEHPEQFPNGDKDLLTEKSIKTQVQAGEKVLDVTGTVRTLECSPNHLMNTLAAHPYGDKAYKILKMLVSYKADINSSLEGETPLSIAINQQNYKAVKFLVTKGANVNIPNQYGDTPLTTAVLLGDQQLLNILVASKKTNLNALNDDGTTALHMAVDMDDAEMVKTLLSAGADINAVNRDGDTPLVLALSKGYDDISYDIVEQLVKSGADVNAKSQFGNTPLDLLQNPYAKVIELLQAHGAKTKEELEAQQHAMQNFANFLQQAMQQPQQEGLEKANQEAKPEVGVPAIEKKDPGFASLVQQKPAESKVVQLQEQRDKVAKQGPALPPR